MEVLDNTCPIKTDESSNNITSKLWTKYEEKDLEFIKRIISKVPYAMKKTFEKAVNQLNTYGITFLHDLFDPIEIEHMQDEYDALLATKPFRHNVSFDGNSGEKCLQESLFLSEAVANSTIRNVVEAYYGQPVNLSYEKMYTDVSKKGYKERAYRPHHDGHSHIDIKVMILLTDVKQNTLGMRYCCGTHKYIHPTTRSRETQITHDYWKKLKHIDCFGKAGTIIIFNPNGIHSGYKDIMETHKRSVIIMDFQPGPLKNYYVSPLHPYISGSFTTYERYAYKIIKMFDIEPDDSDEKCYQKIVQSRVTRKAFHQDIDINVKTFTLTDLDLEKSANINKMVINTQPPTYETNIVSRNELKKDMQNIKLVSEKIKKHMIKINMDDVINMIYGDLDLPVRMYDPRADVLRDNALIGMRDSKLFDKIKKLIERHIERFNENTLDTHFIFPDIERLIRLLDFKAGLEDVNTKQFCHDLIEMLQRNDNTIDSLMKTILWSIIVISKKCSIDQTQYFDAIFFYAIWNYI